MCIAILTTAGKVLDDEVFRRCWRNNAHGFGMAWVGQATGDVIIDKGWMDLNKAMAQYKHVAENWKNADRHMLLHFRAATVGKIDESNCHPFKVKGGAMIHNGTFWRDAKATKSDSQMLAEMMHNELHYANLVQNKEQFDKAFGYNRVVFLFKDDKPVIFSEDYVAKEGKFGQWKDGIWYSNGGWHRDYGGYYGDNAPATPALTQKELDEAALEAMDEALWGYNPNRRAMMT